MKKGKLLKSFRYAFEGIAFCVRHERNVRIHLAIAAIVIACGLYFQVETEEWIVLLLTIGIVISIEMLNTAVEKAVDLTTSEFHPLAKLAKDIAAGAVLLFSFVAAIIGTVIFLPYFF
ncbi:MAG: diacylglycerol kinase family protein [Ectobacillus sp.]